MSIGHTLIFIATEHVLESQRLEDLCEFRASLVYRVSSSTAREHRETLLLHRMLRDWDTMA